MKRSIICLGLLVLAAVCSSVIAPTSSVLGVNDFTIRSFETDYYLDKDAEGRSILKTVEKIEAAFPAYDQNHGIERAIPTDYDGRSTNLNIQSVTDRDGEAVDYTTSTSNGNLVLRIGDADKYVHGSKQYIITYTQRDVTKFFANTNDDEFYWDVNGTQWPQHMERVEARLHVALAAARSLNDKASCYKGPEGGAATCGISKETSSGGTVLSASVNNIGPYETVTIAVGFAPHTFVPYQQTWQEKLFSIWLVTLAISFVVALGVIIWMIVYRRKIMNRVAGRGTIVAEYLPPKDTSVLLSAQALKHSTSDITAQLLDLAVRHYIKIYQTKEKTLFRSAEYEIEVVKDTTALHPEELRLLQAIFGWVDIKLGSRIPMKKLRGNATVTSDLQENRKQLLVDARGKYGLFEYAEKEAKTFRKVGFIALVFGIVTASPFILLACIVAFAFAHTLWPLTEKGVALRDYLAGLKRYISVAEEERIRMLQSPEGAEKVGAEIKGDDPKMIVKLYERVLPYAVLFGIEKEWFKQLGVYYETSGMQPDWYTGQTAFNAAVFSSSLSSFSTQSSSYSSSGGADGGGSSGGSGGGGGGGGW